EPTGILKDTAIDLVDKVIPPPSEAELADGLKAAMAEANRHGLTCVDTMSSWRDIEAMRRARDIHQLNLRIRAFVQEDDWRPYLDRAKSFPNDEWMRVVGFKQYADGSLGSRTAFMAAPFSDKADSRGLHRECLEPNPSNGELPLAVTARTASKSGLGLATHAIGDQANHLVLNAYESSKVGLPTHPAILRVEHAQHLLPDDIKRFGTLGVVASMQPLHKADDGRYAEKAIGPERCKTSYAFRSLLNAGAHVAFGSDWPVVSLDPFLGIHAAVTGETLDGKVFVPEQNLSVEEALKCYTSGAAYASGDDGVLGVIKVGVPADFVVCEPDLLTVGPSGLSHIQVKSTYVAGRQVYSSTR
ncbi:MAG TPA: amidohydrolase, partial [Phycisphaerae bacterium]|nr:amidohydrolase [Phycisphaerae bacterium]